LSGSTALTATSSDQAGFECSGFSNISLAVISAGGLSASGGIGSWLRIVNGSSLFSGGTLIQERLQSDVYLFLVERSLPFVRSPVHVSDLDMQISDIHEFQAF
jgi:hypothetical protein